jgi:hypothetical protein
MISRKTALWVAVAMGVAAGAVLFYGLRHGLRQWKPQWSVVQGAVVRSSADVRKQQPIGGVFVTADYGTSSLSTRSDPSGYFRIEIPRRMLPGQTVTLHFQQPGYKPLVMPVTIQFRNSLRRLLVADMTPISADTPEEVSTAGKVVSNLRVRYTVNTEDRANIGSAAKTFEVVNAANIPCGGQGPCSPDGRWKAAAGSIRLDAGAGNEFRDARATCIAGPCPFTRIDDAGFRQPGQFITARAFDWSDTATFLLQAEVFHTSSVPEVRVTYPVVFGPGFNFTVPPTAEGTSLLAELSGTEIVFPLGPTLELSWATCQVRKGASAVNTVYQCEMKPGYRF